jgi:hypothetical protein
MACTPVGAIRAVAVWAGSCGREQQDAYLAVASTPASAVTFMAVPGHEQAKDAVVIAQSYGVTASTALLTGAGRVDWRMKKGSSLPVQSSARRHLMTGEPVCDPFADHLRTPQKRALIIIDYQPVQVSSIRSMDQEGPAGRPPEQRHRLKRPTARSALADLSDPAVAAIAADAGRTPAQVLLRWAVQRCIPVITKSTLGDRIEENLRIFDFELPDEAMPRFDALDRTGGTSSAIETRIKWW